LQIAANVIKYDKTERKERAMSGIFKKSAAIAVLVLLTACTLLSSCGAARENTREFFAMDTYMTLRAYGADDETMSALTDEVYALENLLSTTREGSDIYALNETGEALLDPRTQEILQFALDMCAETEGALDITIYPAVAAWGFTTGEYRVPGEAELATLLEAASYRDVTIENGKVTLPQGGMIDLGSVAKGYTADILSGLLREAGVTSAVMDLGGNIQTVGAKPDGSPWRIAVRSPEGDGTLGVLEVEDCAVVTSGGYERFFTGEDGTVYWHIIDPSTGAPARNGAVSVTVVGSSGAVCDALSTALFVMGPERALNWLCAHDYGVGAIIVTDDGRLIVTPGLAEKFTPDGGINYEYEVARYE